MSAPDQDGMEDHPEWALAVLFSAPLLVSGHPAAQAASLALLALVYVPRTLLGPDPATPPRAGD